MTAEPATLLSAAVTILAVSFLFYTGLVVARMRGVHKVAPPAMTGHPEFERAIRVQMNTLEQMIVFLPLLWIATAYFKVVGWLPAALGLVWIIGRWMYMSGYLKEAAKRSTGFLVGMLATTGLLILSVWGLIAAWLANSGI